TIGDQGVILAGFATGGNILDTSYVFKELAINFATKPRLI
ncbi:unnamed protein product, partial [marine sediment metagenome]